MENMASIIAKRNITDIANGANTIALVSVTHTNTNMVMFTNTRKYVRSHIVITRVTTNTKNMSSIKDMAPDSKC